MAKVKLKGEEVSIFSDLPEPGSEVPDFILTDSEMKDKQLTDFNEKFLILNIFPSLDTSTCASSVRKFNSAAASLENTKVLCISEDLPFAHSRFCSSEGLNDVVTLSDFRHRKFGIDYGVRITSGPLEGLLARSVLVLDHNRKVIYRELVPEISTEPDYEKALASVNAG